MALLRNQDIPFEENLIAGRVSIDPTAPAADATAGNITYTALQLLSGLFVRNGGAANRTDVFPTAAQVVAALAAKYGKAVVGMRFQWILINDTVSANTLAVTLGAGMTSALTNGTQVSAAIAQNASRAYHFRVTNVTPAAEAIVVYA